MSAAAQIVAPSDAQLAYIAGLCDERGLDFPPAVHSKIGPMLSSAHSASTAPSCAIPRATMCACEPAFVCSRCADTPDDPAREHEADPRDDAERDAFADGRSCYDPENER